MGSAGISSSADLPFHTGESGGFAPYGPPGDGAKYKPFYKAIFNGPVTWVRPIFESDVNAMQGATKKPFEVAFLGLAQQSIIVDDRHYGDGVALAKDIAVAMNTELKYLVSMGLEAVQLIDVLAPYTQDEWQMDVQDMFDGQRGVFEGKVDAMLPLFARSKADVIHLETANRGFDELDALAKFPKDKVLGSGVIDAKATMVESPELIATRIRKGLEAVPPDRLLISPDCGLGYFSRTVAYAKLRAMGTATHLVRKTL
jgi:5-methyltetrahydropteroyltriglutamate--homocysteine methyltransferase